MAVAHPSVYFCILLYITVISGLAMLAIICNHICMVFIDQMSNSCDTSNDLPIVHLPVTPQIQVVRSGVRTKQCNVTLRMASLAVMTLLQLSTDNVKGGQDICKID
jgi:hypothetical protein